jgi:hypothetical protein
MVSSRNRVEPSANTKPVSFEAVEAVSRVRAAIAEFIHDGDRWATKGRVYFNLAPSAAVKYLANALELVAEEHAAKRA